MEKKILFVFPYNTWGGAFRSSYILSNKLIERGWEVDIIFPIIPPRNGFKILSINWLKLKIIGLARSFIRRNKVKIDKLYTILELLFLNTPRINNDINDKEINISDVIKFIFSINFYPQNKFLNLHYMSELNCL